MPAGAEYCKIQLTFPAGEECRISDISLVQEVSGKIDLPRLFEEAQK